MHHNNTNPFALDQGGSKRSRLAGDEYLLPYWMARYFKVINNWNLYFNPSGFLNTKYNKRL